MRRVIISFLAYVAAVALMSTGSGIPMVSDTAEETAPAPASAIMPLTMLQDPRARCMDGTQSGIYVRPSPTGSKKWVFTLQGGGECVTETRCKHAATSSALGSSKYFPANYSFWADSKAHFVDASCTGNPTLCNYNFVYMPYCSQDLWTGQRVTVSPKTFGLYFSGRWIVKATLDLMSATHDLKGATEVILSGNSAGGFGVYSNVDYFQAYLPQAKVVGAPIAGFEFYAWPYTGPGHTSSSLADFRASHMASGKYNELWDAVTPGDCLSRHANDPGACLLPCFSYTSVKAPLFIIEAQSDSVVLMGHDWLPHDHSGAPEKAYMHEFHENQTRCLASAMSASSKDGVFNPACFIHTSFTNKILIRGVNYKQGLLKFLAGEPAKFQDDCGELCNPTCN